MSYLVHRTLNNTGCRVVIVDAYNTMRTVLEHPGKYHVRLATKLGDYNSGMKDKLLTVPMHMALLLKEV